jgi:hypothetical protein
LCDTAGGAGGLLGGGSWGGDGNIIAALNVAAPLSRIPSAGGEPAPLTELGPGEVTHRWPQILPGGKAVLFTGHSGVINGFDDATIEVMSLADRRRKTVIRGGTFGRYSPSGHLLYINKGTLFAVPFDLDTLAVHGAPSPLLDRVAYSSSAGLARFDFSRTGTLVYETGVSRRAQFTVQWMDPAGKTQPLLAKPDSYVYPRLSPDGTRLAFSADDIWVYDWKRDITTRLSYGGGTFAPVWSRDGRYIVYWASQGMFWIRSDGAGKPELLIGGKQPQLPYSFMPNDKQLVFHVVPAGSGGLEVWTVPLESDSSGLRAGKPEQFLQTRFNQRDPSFSPDGRWLAYNSDQSGSYEVYVQAFPGKGGKLQISNGGGIYPIFSRNGRDLFFRTLDNRIMVAAYTAKSESFVAEKPRVWSEKRIGDTGLSGANFDVAPDGKRIVALMPLETPATQQAQNHVVFLMNFFDELRRKVPADK